MSDYICPHCRNPIYDEDALLCHFCGQSLQRPGSGILGRMRYGRPAKFWIFLVILTAIGFMIFLIL